MTKQDTDKYLKVLQEPCLPEPSELLGWAQVVEFAGVTPAEMAEILELGWIDPVKTNEEEYLFSRRDVMRISKLLRLRRDLEVNYTGGCIIVDLMERVEELEKEVSELRELM